MTRRHRYLTTWRDEVHEEQPSARTEDEFLNEHGFRE